MPDIQRDDEYKQLVVNFYNEQKEFKEHEKTFKSLKSKFEKQIEDYMDDKKSCKFDGGFASGSDIVLTKIEKITINWIPEKLKRRITRKMARQVINKRYSIRNMKTLSKYLSSCGVDPKEFKKYLDIEETVDGDAIERLSELGEITATDIQGCYTVECSKPYYRITTTRSNWNEK